MIIYRITVKKKDAKIFEWLFMHVCPNRVKIMVETLIKDWALVHCSPLTFTLEAEVNSDSAYVFPIRYRIERDILKDRYPTLQKLFVGHQLDCLERLK